MSLSDNWILHNLYSGLATPDDHLPPSSLFRPKPPPRLTRFKSTITPGMSAHGTTCSTTLNSEIPTPMITPSKFSYFPMNMHIVNKKLESLSRTRNGQLPVLEHLLSEEGSRPLSLGEWSAYGRPMMVTADPWLCVAISCRRETYLCWSLVGKQCYHRKRETGVLLYLERPQVEFTLLARR